MTEQSLDPLAPHGLSPGELTELLAVERRGAPFLALRDGEGSLQIHTLDAGRARTTVGRRGDMDVRIDWDPQVSGLHAELQCLAGDWLVLDDGLSTNGTFINGKRAPTRQRLRSGDRIRVGRTVLSFTDAAANAPVRTTLRLTDVPTLHLSNPQRRVLVALCRPYRDGVSFATPASNQQIGEEVHLSVHTVKMHLRALFAEFELGDMPQNRKRAALAERALNLGVVTSQDLV